MVLLTDSAVRLPETARGVDLIRGASDSMLTSIAPLEDLQ